MATVPANIVNKDLWISAKKAADKVYDKPSAYKSAYIVKKYKELGGKFRGAKKNEGITHTQQPRAVSCSAGTVTLL
jgi:hypothetical protein